MIERDVLEQALGNALLRDATSQSGDAAMLDRLIEHAVETPAPIIRPASWARALPIAGAGVAAGAIILALVAHRAEPQRAQRGDVVPAVEIQTLPAATREPIAAPITSTNALVASEPTAIEAPVETPTAAQLFARANEARRKGHDAEATSTYRVLQRLHPASSEAATSHMALGRMLLDAHREPATALAEFDRYLASGSRGDLREEALIGRALALAQLARSSDERRAWKALLQEYPSSMYADQARERIAALGG